jgi:hypothetical protein
MQIKEEEGIEIKEGTKVVIVGAEDPSHLLRNVISYYENHFDYDNEINYLKADIASINKSWY